MDSKAKCSQLNLAHVRETKKYEEETKTNKCLCPVRYQAKIRDDEHVYLCYGFLNQLFTIIIIISVKRLTTGAASARGPPSDSSKRFRVELAIER